MSQRPFKVVCASGYFDPLHVGHVDYLQNARLLGDKLVVILNADCQRRASAKAMCEADRKRIVESLRFVDEVVLSIDTTQHVSETLARVCPHVFAKGLSASEAEVQACREHGIEIVSNVGSQLHLQDLLASLR